MRRVSGSIGIAKPTDCSYPSIAASDVLIPISSPFKLRTGPPLVPRFSRASNCITAPKSIEHRTARDRFVGIVWLNFD